MDNLYFNLEEIGFKTSPDCRVEYVDTSDIDYSIERLNMVLVTSGKSTVTHYTYGEYMTKNAPIMAFNNKIISEKRIPTKDELNVAFKSFS